MASSSGGRCPVDPIISSGSISDAFARYKQEATEEGVVGATKKTQKSVSPKQSVSCSAQRNQVHIGRVKDKIST